MKISTSYIKKTVILNLILFMGVFLLLPAYVYAVERAFTEEEIKLLKEVKTIKLIVKASSWQGEPYDIGKEVRKKMELVGFVIVSEEISNYDATMFVDYEENKSSGYSLRIGDAPSDYGTCIDCSIRLEHKKMGTVFKMQTSGCTPSIAEWGKLFNGAFRVFENDNNGAFFFLGIHVASVIGKTEMPPNKMAFLDFASPTVSILKAGEPVLEYFISGFIDAMKDRDLNVRWKAARKLGELHAIRAVDALITALRDENEGVRWNAAIALRSIQLLKTTTEDEYFGEDSVKWQGWWDKNKAKYR